MPVELYRREDLMKVLKCGPTTLASLVKRENFPKPRRVIGTPPTWLSPEIDAWLLAQPVMEKEDQ